MAEAFGIACHELVSLGFRCGSGSDYRHRHPERPHLGVERTESDESGPSAADLPLSGVLLS
jgi:hypothetical protein